MLGPVFARDGAAFARVGLEALAAEFGVTIGDNLVVDPTRASDVEGPSVWAAGPTSYRPHPLTTRFGGRLTYWPRTREVAPLDRPVPGLAVTTLVQTSPEGWGETDLATIRGEADLAFDSARDRKGPVSVAVAVERGGATSDAAGFSGHRAAGHELPSRGPDAARLRRRLRHVRDLLAGRSRCAGRRRAQAGGAHRARPDRGGR